MKRVAAVFALIVANICCPLSLPAQAPQEESSADALPLNLSELQLEPAKRAEIEQAVRERNLKHAETILVQESELAPKTPRSARLLQAAAGLFFRDQQYLDAAIAWKRAESIAALDDRNRFMLAMAWIKLNRRDWARPEIEKLCLAQPQNPLYLYWLARLDYDSQNYTVAITRLQKVTELDPRMTRAYDRLGLCYDYLGRWEEAINSYNRAVELNRLEPKPSPWPLVDLAISLVELNRLTEAEDRLREAVRYDDGLPQAHYQLGRVLDMQAHTGPAIESLKQSISLDPGYAEPHYLLGRIYQKLGNSELAKAEIDQYQQLTKNRNSQPAGNSQPATK